MKIYEDISLYFVTSTIVEWYPVFTKRAYFSLIIDSLEYCRKEKGLRIHAYVIMLNHVHLIVSMDDVITQKTSLNFSDILRDFKRFTSNKISKLLQEEGNNRVLNIFEKTAIKGRLLLKKEEIITLKFGKMDFIQKLFMMKSLECKNLIIYTTIR